MLIVVATTIGLMIWIVLWAIGGKAFDAFMITVVIIVLGATVHILTPYLPGNRER